MKVGHWILLLRALASSLKFYWPWYGTISSCIAQICALFGTSTSYAQLISMIWSLGLPNDWTSFAVRLHAKEWTPLATKLFFFRPFRMFVLMFVLLEIEDQRR